MTKLKADSIECAHGWQAEIFIQKCWHLYTKVYKTKNKCILETKEIAKKFGWTIDFEEEQNE